MGLAEAKLGKFNESFVSFNQSLGAAIKANDSDPCFLSGMQI